MSIDTLVATIIFLTGMFPVVGYTLCHVKFNGKKWLVLTTCVIVFFSMLAFTFAKQIDIEDPPTILYLSYAGFMIFFLVLLTRKYGYDKFNVLLGVTLLLTYVTTQWWEIPVYIFAVLGVFGKEYLGPWNQIYLATSFILALKMGKVKITKTNILLLLSSLVTSTLIIMRYPGLEYSGGVWMVNRFIGYACLGATVYFWGDLS